MKSIPIIGIIALMCTSTACASTDADGERPRFHKFVKCNSESGINIRKSPSASAPRAVYKNTDSESDYTQPYQYRSFWSTAKSGGSIQAMTFDEYVPLPLVSETEGWYEIYGAGPLSNGTFENGWVSANYCTVADMTPITLQTLNNNTSLLKRIAGDQIIFYVSDLSEGMYCFYIGKLCDGQIICNDFLKVDYLVDTPDKTYFTKTTNNGSEMHCSASETDGEELLLENFSQETINQLLKNAEKASHPFTIWYDGEAFHCYQPTLPMGAFM